ncbi:hypothetical protein [Chitinophaga caeni]|nr:hypothetical protein [Chitinophaga caeni]
MKVLKLHPYMTVALLQMQFQRLLHCNVVVYARHSSADEQDVLRDVGFIEAALVEHPIDETLSLREFEEVLEDQFNISMEICNNDWKPFTNKSLRLFQLPAMLKNTSQNNNNPLDLGFDFLARLLPPNSAQPNII